MRFTTRALAGLAIGSLFLAGCSHHTVTSRAFGPTADEAERIADAQLLQKQIEISNTKGTKYHLVGKPHYSTNSIQQVDGSYLYEVTAKQGVEKDGK